MTGKRIIQIARQFHAKNCLCRNRLADIACVQARLALIRVLTRLRAEKDCTTGGRVTEPTTVLVTNEMERIVRLHAGDEGSSGSLQSDWVEIEVLVQRGGAWGVSAVRLTAHELQNIFRIRELRAS